ncbi:hypothetical protein AFK24_20605 [Pseudomonas syringae]|uniref:Putative adhesin Stv domain-containing protein n=1 Tax=Pseudomonas syringae TaxID=317 RepID=A0A1C7YZZ5_PSESX|nr:RHS repeat-associated core domain-containing protein [Pseudomonas syringae]OCR23103.1 hypothetical protein AFK24_20605 [Pseudomonas syringae]
MNEQSTALHPHTPLLTTFDPRGLTVRSVAWCRTQPADSAEARVTRSAFNAAGRLVSSWDPRLWADQARANLSNIYSLRGEVLCSESVDAGWRLSLPGEGGELSSGWDGRGTERRLEYDARLRPTAIFENDQCLERLQYGDADAAAQNQCGQLVRHDDPAGTRRTIAFGLTGAALEQTQHFLAQLDDPDWPELESERDALLEPGAGASTRWAYTPLGEVLRQTDALGNVQAFAHTVAGQLKAVSVQLKDQPEQVLVSAISYDAQGRVQSETAGNGVITTAVYRAEDGRLIELKASRNNGDHLQDLLYDYDPVGNVIRIEDRAQSTRYFANQRIEPVSSYQYDTLYQLIEATGREAATVNHGPVFPEFQSPPDPTQLANYTQTYRYDAGGNLQQLTHVGAQAHSRTLVTARTSNRSLPVVNEQPPDEETIAAAFDANGNLLQLQAGQALSWDWRNQLQQVRSVVRETGDDDSERYIYDASGQRLRKVGTRQAKTVSHHDEVRYLPGLEIRTNTATGETLHVITTQAGRSSVRMLHWQAGKPDALENDQTRYTLNDHLGSGTLELDKDAQIISQESYYPFGGTSWWAGRNAIEASYKTVRYSGKERDATGLYYYGLRYYAPWLQRWINSDPAGALDGLNVYRMVRNSPMRFHDQEGEVSQESNHPHEIEGASLEPGSEKRPDLKNNEDALTVGSLHRRGSVEPPQMSTLVNAWRFLPRVTTRLWQIWNRPAHNKFVTVNFPDFTIRQFELHNPSAPKDLIIHGHGRLRSPVHKIYSSPLKLNFYARANTQLEASSNDLHRFQSRKVEVLAAEVIAAGAESRDYDIAHSPAFDDPVSAFLHHSQLLNPKPVIASSGDFTGENYHDVLIVKRGKTISLSKILRHLPSYNQVHGFFCRTRGQGGPSHDPFLSSRS